MREGVVPFAGNHDTFLAKGHTIPYGKPLAENTRLTGYILSDLQNFPREASYVTLPDGDKGQFLSSDTYIR